MNPSLSSPSARQPWAGCLSSPGPSRRGLASIFHPQPESVSAPLENDPPSPDA